jgi:lysophospholipase L1-like esterase
VLRLPFRVARLRVTALSTTALSTTTLAAAAALAGLAAVTAPASAQAAVRPAAPGVRYMALGDSYAAGLGAGATIGSSGSCARSRHAYPALWAAIHHPASFRAVTCSGATTRSALRHQVPKLGRSTNLISLTIGGNDVGFEDVITTCILQSDRDCLGAIHGAEHKINGPLPGRLDRLLSAIGARSPHARVVLAGYPHLYDANPACPSDISRADRAALNQAADQLDGQLAAAAARHGYAFADVRPAFAGHAICDGASWINGINLGNLDSSFHPTRAGQARGYLPAFSRLAA